MKTFQRFIFLLIVSGALVNLFVVMFSNARTHETQLKDNAVERERFEGVIKTVSKQMRRGELVVEWQRVDANQKVVETSLLVREFLPADENGPRPLPTVRVIIPGDRVCVDGLKLSFDSLFMEEYKELRSAELYYFGHVYADDEKEKESADGTTTDTRFTFLTEWEAPEATRVAPANPRPTYFESKLWHEVWEMIDSKNPEQRGLTRTWLTPACKVVKIGAIYPITVGLEGVTIGEDDSEYNRVDRDRMIQEIAHKDAVEGAGK